MKKNKVTKRIRAAMKEYNGQHKGNVAILIWSDSSGRLINYDNGMLPITSFDNLNELDDYFVSTGYLYRR